MDPVQAQKKDGRAFGVSHIEWVGQPYVHPAYALDPNCPEDLTSTGMLVVFRFLPNAAPDHGFFGRWDNDVDTKNKPEPRLKIYLIPRPGEAANTFAQEEYAFDHGLNGYAGHHPHVVRHGGAWAFDIELRNRGTLILSGRLSLGVRREIVLGDTLSVSADIAVSAEIIREGDVLP